MRGAFLIALAGVCWSAIAGVSDGRGYGEVEIDVSGLKFVDLLGASMNSVVMAQHPFITENAWVSAVAWDVTIETTLPSSWLSDTRMRVSTQGGEGLSFAFAPGDNFGGAGSYSSGGWVAFDPDADLGVGGDDAVRIEFYEAIDDLPGLEEAVFLPGSVVRLGMRVPGVGTGAIVAGGLLAGTRRRR